MRFVITGGPSVGKTTIIDGLAAMGYQVVQEQATQIIKEGVFLPWVDRVRFQEEVLRRQRLAEANLKATGSPVFLDRGLFDGEAYYLFDRLPVPSIFASLDASAYTAAFLAEELSFFDNNGIRWETIEFTRQITVILEHCYASRGVEVIRVPALPPAERIRFVLDAIDRLSKPAPARSAPVAVQTAGTAALTA